jgi:uncharacterized protein YbgA (DUF1722 family)/uncharacterized protein YbbK (DUF523 family)
MSTHPPIRLGISSCLLGEAVRYDGSHKRDPFLVQTLGPMVEWVPVCPEVEVGLGTPRETIRLIRDPKELDGVRLVTGKTGVDLTKRMHRYSRQRVRTLAKENLSGYILKKDSPSCGMERVKVWHEQGGNERNGHGLFAAELRRQFPNMPVEEEGRLHDPRLRENFIDRVFMYRRLRALFCGRWTVGDLVSFHTAYKLVLMAHSPQGYRELGRLVAEANDLPRAELVRCYEDELMAAMAKPATRARHTNTLQHTVGHFKQTLDQVSRRELASVIEDYRQGLIPLIVPLTLIRHHARRLDVSYLLGQRYLDPELKELMLRNHV